MIEQETREKIKKVLDETIRWEPYYYIFRGIVYEGDLDNIADALIAANIGDVTEWKERAEKHRAEVAERALDKACADMGAVRKQAVEDVLLTMLERMDRLTGCGVPYHVKKFINDIAVENGIELVKEVCGDD